MPAEVGAWFLPWRHEIRVRGAARSFTVVALVLEAEGTRVVGVQVTVKIAEPDDVEAERLHRGNVLYGRVEGFVARTRSVNRRWK